MRAAISDMTCSASLSSQMPGQFSALTVFCDFDGPLVDVSSRYYHTYQLALADVQATYQGQGMALPIHLLSKEQFWQMKRNRTPDPEIAQRSGLVGPQIEVFLQRVQQIVNQPILLHQDTLQPGVRWALHLLHSLGAQLVLVTLRNQQQANQILESYQLRQLFTEIWGMPDVQAAYCNSAQQKTQLLTEAIACHTIGHPHQRNTWMIGDTEADILAGQTTGVPTIALTCGIRSKTYLERFQPTRIHSDLLSAAHFLLCKQEEASQNCKAVSNGAVLGSTKVLIPQSAMPGER
jgi:phosphoglycolate phosphatase-like HAD superfamily hydrolase